MPPDKRMVPALLIPTPAGCLVLPNLLVCEVIVNPGLSPLPGTEEWVLGYCIWRDAPVSVISFERLVGRPIPTSPMRKIVILYPLQGRNPYDFFGVATTGEPHVTNIDDDAKPADPPPDLLQRYVTCALSLADGPGLIPDFEAWKAVFYSNMA